MKQRRLSRGMAAKVGASALSVGTLLFLPGMLSASASPAPVAAAPAPTTPIQHVVVIFGENVSFDHYFATYPNATNTDGQTFNAKPGTPAVNGLAPSTKNGETNLLVNNPNGVNPVRLDPTNVNDVLTCDQNRAGRVR
jgi:phospholipase C